MLHVNDTIEIVLLSYSFFVRLKVLFVSIYFFILKCWPFDVPQLVARNERRMVHSQQVRPTLFDPFSYPIFYIHCKILNISMNIVEHPQKFVVSKVCAIRVSFVDDHDTNIATISVIYEWRFGNNFWNVRGIPWCVLTNFYAGWKIDERI